MKIKLTFQFMLLAGFFLIVTSCNSMSVNKSIQIEDGESVSENLRSVNGNISIGENCMIRGGCQTVNGAIEIGDNTPIIHFFQIIF